MTPGDHHSMGMKCRNGVTIILRQYIINLAMFYVHTPTGSKAPWLVLTCLSCLVKKNTRVYFSFIERMEVIPSRMLWFQYICLFFTIKSPYIKDSFLPQ